MTRRRRAKARRCPTEDDKAYDDRVKGALDRLRELAASRGQELKEAPPQAASAAPQVQPNVEAEKPVPKPSWERGPLPSWARAWAPSQRNSDVPGGHSMAQRIVLIVGFLAILGMALFPPWVYVYTPPRNSEIVRTERPAGYHLILGSHIPQDQTQLVALFNLPLRNSYDSALSGLQFFSLRIDSLRLEIQIAATLILTAILYLALRSTKPAAR